MPFHKLTESKAYRHSLEFIVGNVGKFFYVFLTMPLNKMNNRQTLVSKHLCENLYTILKTMHEWGVEISSAIHEFHVTSSP